MSRTVSVLVLGAVVLVPRAATATTFDEITIEELAEASDVVARGRVVDAVTLPNGPSGLRGIHTRVVIAVQEVLGGDAGRELVVWVHGGRIGDTLRVVHGQARFSIGEDVVVFLFRSPQGDFWPTGMARGKWLVTHDGAGDLVRPSASLSAVDGADAAVPRVSRLGELRSRVAAARGEP